MDKLHVEIDNCYGIGKIDKVFDFSGSTTILLYAPNGMMKSSFAKVFGNYSQGESSCDEIDNSKDSRVSLVWEDGSTLIPDSVFVVQPEKYLEAGESVTAFLASDDLKKRHDELLKDLNAAKNSLWAKLKELSHSSDCEEELKKAFCDPSGSHEENDFELLTRVLAIVEAGSWTRYDFKYNIVFDKANKTREFVAKCKSLIDDYFSKYQQVLTESSFFRRTATGKTFGTEQANALIKSLEDSSFFEVGHQIYLNGSEPVTNYADFVAARDAALAGVVNSPAVKKAFDKVDKAVGANQAMRDLKTLLVEHNEFVAKLADYEEFRREVWCSHLSVIVDELRNLVLLYGQKKVELDQIYRDADAQQEKWSKIVDLFNDRFHAPFKVCIKNQRDLLLKRNAAALSFVYDDGSTSRIEERDPRFLIEKVLSRGEMRAFCLLQILFEIEARKLKGEVMLVFDDVADSFDYKNKYAIVEYLRDLKEDARVKAFVLTHNLDFYRTVASRLALSREANCLLVTKNPQTRELRFCPGEFLRNLLVRWVQNPNRRIALAMLAFVRNLVEVSKGNTSADYYLLTSCLHYVVRDPNLTPTSAITIRDVLDVYKREISTFASNPARIESAFTDASKKWIECLGKEADDIGSETTVNEIALENKVVLAVMIRILTEAYMQRQLEYNGISTLSLEGKGNRFGVLYTEFKTRCPADARLRTLNRVSIMTPEHIHFNSFMYEPLVDMSIQELLALFKDVKNWNVIL